MAGRSVSPGGALLRGSRMFSIPKPLPEPPSTSLSISDHKSNTMTRQYPQHQSITSPLSSREKGDWGLKRAFPLKSTMATSTPLIRIKQLDTMENVTDFASAADHTLSLEKFQELRIAMAVPSKSDDTMTGSQAAPRLDLWPKSVFEEDTDFTDFKARGRADDRRWKFQGPWLARMTEGQFSQYLSKKVRPKRAQLREQLKGKLAREITAARNRAAAEEGKEPGPPVKAADITEEQYAEYLRSLRNDRVTLYALVSKFLDLAPLGQPPGFITSIWGEVQDTATESPYGKTGPPLSHPSAGISYLRTSSFLENHQVYGPQANRTPALARVVLPRMNANPVRLGVGGFVANAPAGDTHQNTKAPSRSLANKTLLNGITFLDTTTFGGAKAYVQAQNATVDPSGRVILQLRETTPEAQLIAKENKGLETIYHDGATKRYEPTEADDAGPAASQPRADLWRMDRVADEVLGNEDVKGDETDIVSSSSSYGLGTSTHDQR